MQNYSSERGGIEIGNKDGGGGEGMGGSSGGKRDALSPTLPGLPFHF